MEQEIWHLRFAGWKILLVETSSFYGTEKHFYRRNVIGVWRTKHERYS